jgi:hypothetical protein
VEDDRANSEKNDAYVCRIDLPPVALFFLVQLGSFPEEVQKISRELLRFLALVFSKVALFCLSPVDLILSTRAVGSWKFKYLA